MFDAVMNAMNMCDIDLKLRALLTRDFGAAELSGKVELVQAEGGGRCGNREGGEKKQEGRHKAC